MKDVIGFLARYRLIAGFLLACLFLWMARPSAPLLAWGGAVSLAGLGIRFWASGHIRKTRELAVDGPYSLVRNPLYLGSFIVGAGVVLTGGSIWWLLGFAAAFLPVYFRKMRQEEAHLAALFGATFDEYRRRVPRFVPRLALPTGGRGFDLRQVLRHKEYELWLGIAAIFAILGWKAWR
jgi:protein-S-isoprenylcysteine O-methyltransferase Ste14